MKKDIRHLDLNTPDGAQLNMDALYQIAPSASPLPASLSPALLRSPIINSKLLINLSCIMKQRLLTLFTALVFSILIVNADVQREVWIKESCYSLDKNTHTACFTKGGILNTMTGEVAIPSEVEYEGENYVVTKIGYNAFNFNSDITSVVIPETITSIGEFAFLCCENLAKLQIPKSVSSIGNGFCMSCEKLLSIDVADDNQYFCEVNGVLYNKDKSLLHSFPAGKSGEFVISGDVTKIGDYAFASCHKLTALIIPGSVTRIGNNAVECCNGIESVSIDGFIEDTGLCTFTSCPNLKSVHIKSLSDWSRISFGNEASNPLCNNADLYLNGEKVTKLVIPDDVTRIGGFSFYNCRSIESVVISNSVKEICGYAFCNCRTLTSVDFQNAETTIGSSAFEYCTALASLVISNSVKAIKDHAFCYCSNLQSVDIGNSVTDIEMQAFLYCDKLTNVTIGSSVKFLEDAFQYCPCLSTVICKAENVPTATIDCFLESNLPNASLYVPGASLLAYKSAEPWKNFGSIFAITNTKIQSHEKDDVEIRSSNGFINISGLDTNERVDFYATDGKTLGSAKSIEGKVSFSAQQGTVVVAKIGNESIKIFTN